MGLPPSSGNGLLRSQVSAAHCAQPPEMMLCSRSHSLAGPMAREVASASAGPCCQVHPWASLPAAQLALIRPSLSHISLSSFVLVYASLQTNVMSFPRSLLLACLVLTQGGQGQVCIFTPTHFPLPSEPHAALRPRDWCPFRVFGLKDLPKGWCIFLGVKWPGSMRVCGILLVGLYALPPGYH